MLGRGFIKSLPALKFIGKQILGSQIARDVGSSLKNSTFRGLRNVAIDAVRGNNVRESFTRELGKARQDIAKALGAKTSDAKVNKQKRKRSVSTHKRSGRAPRRLKKSLFNEKFDDDDYVGDDEATEDSTVEDGEDEEMED
jgi:DNA-directed RNA polymerase specialized sigma24 family protein